MYAALKFCFTVVVLVHELCLALPSQPIKDDVTSTGCVGSNCGSDFMELRSKHHLENIKKRIQFVLGITPGILNSSQTKAAEIALPGPIERGDMDVIGEEADESLKIQAEKQIILADKGKLCNIVCRNLYSMLLT